MIFTPSSILYPRFGITVSKRVGNAVVRNKLKRQLRDILRHHKPSMGYDFVFIAKPGAAEASYKLISQDVISLLERASKQLARKNNAPSSL